MRMDPIYILVILNLIAGFGCAIPLVRFLKKVDRKPRRVFRYFAILIGVYLVECVGIAMGMGIPVFSVGLAFVWGIVFGLRLRDRASTGEVVKTSFFLSLYSSLPAVSFVLIPLLVWIGGGQVLSAEAGIRFGIPPFLHLPWPLNTILGFYAALAIGAVVFKTVITTGEVSLLIHYWKKKVTDSQVVR